MGNSQVLSYPDYFFPVTLLYFLFFLRAKLSVLTESNPLALSEHQSLQPS